MAGIVVAADAGVALGVPRDEARAEVAGRRAAGRREAVGRLLLDAGFGDRRGRRARQEPGAGERGRRAGGPGEPLHRFSPRTRSLKRRPRSSKSRNWSNKAQAGDSSSTSPFAPTRKAVSTAVARSPHGKIGTKPPRSSSTLRAALPIVRIPLTLRSRYGFSGVYGLPLCSPPRISS